MSRTVAVFHELNEHALPLGRRLANLLDTMPPVWVGGTPDLPLPQSALSRFVDERPDRRVFLAPYVRPIFGLHEGVHYRPVVPLCHPMTQTLDRLNGWSREAWLGEHGALPTPEQEPAAIAAYVKPRLEQAWKLSPPVNLQIGLLSGDPDASETIRRETAALLLDHGVPLLADFWGACLPGIVLALLAAGAALVGPLDLATSGETHLVRKLIHWSEVLPNGLFETLCDLNRNDLMFFDDVAPAAVENSPLPPPVRDQILAALEQAAEITGHRRKAATTSGETRRGQDRMIEADPELGYRYRPNAWYSEVVFGQEVVQQTDSTGHRPVPKQPDRPVRSFAAFGCSFTFGFATPVEETFCAILQERFPDWLIENRGINGYGPHQNFIELRRDGQWDMPDYVAFCFFPDHYRRIVADASCLQGFPTFTRPSSPVHFYPRVGLDENEELTWRKVLTKRSAFLGVDLWDFQPDRYYMERVYVALVAEAARLVREQGKIFFVVTLRGQPSAFVKRRLAEENIPFVDADVPETEEYTYKPFDGHPNGKANRIFADRIETFLRQSEARAEAGVQGQETES